MPPRLPASGAATRAPLRRLARALLPSRLLSSAGSAPPPARRPPRDAAAGAASAGAGAPPAAASSSGRLASVGHAAWRQSASAPGSTADRLLTRYKRRAEVNLRTHHDKLDRMRREREAREYLRHIPRRFHAGDVYAPRDISPTEMARWRVQRTRDFDVVDRLGLGPLDLYKVSPLPPPPPFPPFPSPRSASPLPPPSAAAADAPGAPPPQHQNFSLVRDFTTSSGQILHSRDTGLRPVNQRKVARMVRRAQGMGLYPTVHDHPEVMRGNFYPLGGSAD